MAELEIVPRDEMRRDVTIECVFGSVVQRDVALRTLRAILAAWKRDVEPRHEKNTITITET
jgi:hypothetical protein